jgi:dihydroorotate dehydrogenase subfamily 2
MKDEIFNFGYKKILKPLFFKIDPELTHDMACIKGRVLASNKITKRIVRAVFHYSNPMLKQTVAGIVFENPIGLAAGFDKNARLTGIVSDVGFGFEEIGSVTGEPCAGNARPRLWRLVNLESLRVYYGLKNDGAEAISKRLANQKFELPIGVSIAKTNCRETINVEAGIRDYVKVYNAFKNIGAYDAINISCPNAYGGEPFTDSERLERLMCEIDKVRNSKPMFIKLPSDINTAELDQIVKIARAHKVNGFISTNLTKKHEFGAGGISGKPLKEKSDSQLKYLFRTYGREFVYIGCGGVFTAQDAYEKIRAGASLVQLITGMIYEGPQLIGQINKNLVTLLKRDGFENISDAVGVDLKI